MGSFSWLRAEDGTRYMNIATNHVGFRLLVPKPFVEEFGDNIRVEKYLGYGRIMHNGVIFDMFGLLAKFNKDFLDKRKYKYQEVKGVSNQNGMVCDNETFANREIGIAIGCYARESLILRYPFKLVSLSYEGNYESCKGFSLNDPEQGAFQTHWEDNDKTKKMRIVCKKYWELREKYERRLEKGLPPIDKNTEPAIEGLNHDIVEKAMQLPNV